MEQAEGIETLLQAQSGLWNHIYNYINSMSLKCAVDLGIPDVIHHHDSRPISLSSLSAALAVPPARSSHLGRLMRLLTHSGVFSTETKRANEEEDAYLLTPISRLLVKDTAGGHSPFLLAMLHPIMITPFQSMAAWFKGDDAPTPFAAAHGCGLWEVANRNPGYNKLFNAAMAGDACFLMDVLLKDCGHVFRGLTSLVDVGGGTGSAAKAISEAFPQVKCTVLDLPHVVADPVPENNGTVAFVAGDMFDYIPPADALLLKSILHDWDDEDCVKILRRCKEAIPCREEGGKVIIVDMMVGSKGSDHTSRETQLHSDVMMLVLCGGAERDEQEWNKIFIDAGFTDYKIMAALGLRSVIELY